MLQVEELNQYYGGSHILRGLSFEARIGEVTCLLGRNGVGKTTLLKCLMGLVPARSGSVRWQGETIIGKKPHQRVQAGIAYVPQGREIFPRLTVEENLLMGLARFSGAAARTVPDPIYDLFPVLRQMKDRRGGDLSGGQQQQLAAKGDMAILLVEQFYDFAADLADSYLVMSRGSIVQRGAGSNMEQDGVRGLVAI